MPAFTPVKHSFSVAPMLDWTDRHCRYFYRLMSKHALLYTEMVTTGALLYGNAQRFLEFNAVEHPLALQLGGSNPNDLAICTQMAANQGYNEVNLNVGCPSNKVQNGSFGACLMAKPELVAECVNAMQHQVSIPVSVKSRIGIDNQDSYAELHNFIATIANAGCDTFILHARKAWLQGLSPKQNREIPPLRYDIVFQLKQDFPQLKIILNGGIKSLATAQDLIKQVDGVMLGREIYHNPFILTEVDQKFFGATKNTLSRSEIIQALIPYVQQHCLNGGHLKHISRHILGLFHQQPHAKTWRRYLSENAPLAEAKPELLLDALAKMNHN